MKKFTAVLIPTMMLLMSNSYGQRTPKTYLDLMVNVTDANFYYGNANKTVADYKRSVKGIQAGASFQTGITPSFSAVSEIYYMRKGGRLIADNPLNNSETTIRFNTIELPLLARWHIGKFYVNAGPSIAYAFSGKRTQDDHSEKLSFNHSADGFRRLETGIQAGGGFEFPLKQKRLALDVRYNHGLTNICRGAEMYNRGIMVTVYFSKPWKTNPLAINAIHNQ